MSEDAVALPTSWMLVVPADKVPARLFAVINRMTLDMLAAVARKDYADRHRRQAQWIAKARSAGLCPGRPEDEERNRVVAGLLGKSVSWTQIQKSHGLRAGYGGQSSKARRKLSGGAPDLALACRLFAPLAVLSAFTEVGRRYQTVATGWLPPLHWWNEVRQPDSC